MDAGCGVMARMNAPRPFIYITSELRRIARRFRVPEEIIASVKADPERVARAYRATTDRQYFDLVASTGKVELFGRVTGFAVKPTGNGVMIKLIFPTTQVIWFVDAEKWQKYSADEWYKRLTDWVYVQAAYIARKSKNDKTHGYWRAEKVMFARIEEDREAYRFLVERYRAAGLRPAKFAALIALLGYNPTRIFGESAAEVLLLLRVLPLVADEPIHITEFSRPGTGKTSVALRYRLALRWLYFNEPPTPPSLAGDARTGRSPVAAAGGIWFDEVDKWSQRRTKLERINEAIEILLTAMEQGYWRRGAGGEKQIEVFNPIPMYFSGNIDTPSDPRTVLKTIIAQASGSAAASAFNERIAVAAVVTADVADTIQRAVLPLVGRAAALRGAVAELREQYIATQCKCETRFKGRFKRHHERVARAIRVLFDVDCTEACEAAEELVTGVVITDGSASIIAP